MINKYGNGGYFAPLFNRKSGIAFGSLKVICGSLSLVQTTPRQGFTYSQNVT